MNKLQNKIRDLRIKYGNNDIRRRNLHSNSSFLYIFIFASFLIILQQYFILLIFLIFLIIKYELNILDIVYIFLNAYSFYISLFGIFIYIGILFPKIFDADDIVWKTDTKDWTIWAGIISRQLLSIFLVPFLGGIQTPIWICITILIFDINYLTFNNYDNTETEKHVESGKILKEEILNYKANKANKLKEDN